MCGSSSDGGSNWEPEAPASCLKRAKAARQAKHASPAVQSLKAAAASAHLHSAAPVLAAQEGDCDCLQHTLHLAMAVAC